jgi:DNA polymerase-3 subunit beta
MTITEGGGQVLFHTEDIDLVTRVIEGKYPDISTSSHTIAAHAPS